MSTENRVSARTPQAFGNYRICGAQNANLTATGNAIVAMPILDGGLSNSGSNVTSGCAIVRRITISSQGSGNINTANISVGWTNDGGNLVANAQTLTTMTANNTWLDLIMSGTANTTMLNGNVSSTLYLNVGTSAANAVVRVSVYGDIVRP